MNLSFISNLIKQYKESFSKIHKEEIYKWAAVQYFQEHWDIDHPDFQTMMDNALSKAKNLLDSGSYYPKRMLKDITAIDPEGVRNLFKDLYDEQLDLKGRISRFKEGMKLINDNQKKKNTYQDDRAIIVYLCLKYPERYFLYKFEMFKGFVRKMSYDYIPKRGAIENIFQFYDLCNLIRSEAQKDNVLLLMHQGRLGPKDYADSALTLLTQDIIYAAVRHLEIKTDQALDYYLQKIEEVTIDLAPRNFDPILEGVFINYLDNERESKFLGTIGERMIMDYETKLLKEFGPKDHEPSHDSLKLGDGLGYDIKSFTPEKNPKYIEVKTTRGPYTTPFYITQNELLKSRQSPDQYYLYRLFQIDEKCGTAKLIIHKGSLDHFCVNPSKYTVIL